MIFQLLVGAVAMQVQIGAKVTRDTTDSTGTTREVSITLGSRGDREREVRRIAVTDEHLRTAFATPGARALLERARSARTSQDSALLSYEATSYFRVSAGIGFAKIGRDRLAFRHENVTRTRWHRDYGAWIDVKGARTVIPVIPKDEERNEAEEMASDSDVLPIPYFPGQEPLFTFGGSGMVKTEVNEREMVHPLGVGAEAYYTYRTGDSVTFRLPDGKVVALRELEVRPRESKWNVVVGSLWFDTGTGQLVRAAYRLAEPLDAWAIAKEDDPDAMKDVPIWVRPAVSPIHGQIKAIAVEYGLYAGRFWLPRIRSAEGDARVSFMRVPFKFEQTHRYSNVNALDSVPTIVVAEAPVPPDSLDEKAREEWRDSVYEARADARRAERDSVRKGLIPDRSCDSEGMRVAMRRGRSSGIPIARRVPCDASVLANSPELPKSIYDDGEEVFGSAERDALIKEALAMGVQPPMSIGRIPPTLHYGLQFTRFNRIEGFSTGALVEQPLGGGYTASLFGRIGHADLEPNGELTLRRSNLSTVWRATAYHRLAVANDWGNPLTFGSSISALLFGRDEGFYYRASGLELGRATESGQGLSWRLFAEHHEPARAENEFSLGAKFIPNIAARRANYAGLGARWLGSRGLDPNGFRVFSDLRLESAMSDSSAAAYARGAFDLTLSDAFGSIAAALTLSAGSSAGELPPQRRFYLGGAHTVRGQSADTAQSGNAYWLGRLEIGRAIQGLRPVIFGDIGWTGDREKLDLVGRPLSGVGVGLSILDGLLRFDVSRGLYPRERFRVDMYVEAKF